jgi:hypothetical protein
LRISSRSIFLLVPLPPEAISFLLERQSFLVFFLSQSLLFRTSRVSACFESCLSALSCLPRPVVLLHASEHDTAPRIPKDRCRIRFANSSADVDEQTPRGIDES